MFLKRFKAAPLSSSFFLAGIIGLLITLIYQPINLTWTITFSILFAAIFIASLISMARAPIEAELELEHMSLKGMKKKSKK